MAAKKGTSLGGLIVISAIVSIITIGGVTGVSVALWPAGASAPAAAAVDTAMINAASQYIGFVFFTYPTDFKDYLSPVLADLKKQVPAIKSIAVIDDSNRIVGTDKEADLDKLYQLPKDAKPAAGNKLSVQALPSGMQFVAVPALYNDKVKGGIRMLIEPRKAGPAAGGDGKTLVMIAGLAAMVLGILVPLLAILAKAKSLGQPAAAAAPDAGMAEKIKAMKDEENFLKARIDSAKDEIQRAEEIKSQVGSMEQQIEQLRKQHNEETYKLEGYRKQMVEIDEKIQERRKALDATPAERQASLSREDEELMKKIETHRKEEMALAKKIEEIRKKVIDLDRRIETRRKEEVEITNRIEARRKEEQQLSQKGQ